MLIFGKGNASRTQSSPLEIAEAKLIFGKGSNNKPFVHNVQNVYLENACRVCGFHKYLLVLCLNVNKYKRGVPAIYNQLNVEIRHTPCIDPANNCRKPLFHIARYWRTEELNNLFHTIFS